MLSNEDRATGKRPFTSNFMNAPDGGGKQVSWERKQVFFPPDVRFKLFTPLSALARERNSPLIRPSGNRKTSLREDNQSKQRQYSRERRW
jgi:hypothetical protein